MSKSSETKLINYFDLGMTNEERSDNFRYATLIKGFDTSYRKKLVPNRSSEDAGVSNQDDIQLKTFLMYSGDMYALGIVTDTGWANIMKNTSLSTPSWSSPTNGSDSAGNTGFKLFVEYKGILYGSVPSSSAGRIWSYDIAGTTWTSSAQALNHLAITQGLVHSKTDILYIAYVNSATTNAYVMSKDGAGAFDTTHLTLPVGFIPSYLSEDGAYLVISGIMPNGKFMSFFWDMSSTSWEDTKTIEWGSGAYPSTVGNSNDLIVEKLHGYLVAVSCEGSIREKLVFRKSYGGLVVKFQEFYVDDTVGLKGGQKDNDRLFFGVSATSEEGTTNDWTGIWSVGMNSEGGFSVVIDRTAKNDDTTVNAIYGFIIAQDYFYISYTTYVTVDVFGLSKTDNAATYSSTSYYETLKINGGDSDIKKKLVGATVLFEPLPSAGKVSLKYRKDEESSWTTIFADFTTDDAISHGAVNKSSGATLPEFNELQFQITSYGGAVITGLKYKYQFIQKGLYE